MNEWLTLAAVQKGITGPGGFCDILGVPEEYISYFPSINPVTQTCTDPIVLNNGRAWLSFNLNSRTRAFAEKQQTDKPGHFFSQTVSGNLFGQNEHNHLQLQNMVGHRWVLLVRERKTGITYLVGKPGSSAIMDINYSSQAGTLTEIRFTNLSKSRAWLYGAVLPNTNIVLPPETFLLTMLAEFRIGDAARPAADATEFNAVNVPELIGKTKIAIWIDGSLVSGKGYGDVLSYSYNAGTTKATFNQPLGLSAVVQIYEVTN